MEDRKAEMLIKDDRYDAKAEQHVEAACFTV